MVKVLLRELETSNGGIEVPEDQIRQPRGNFDHIKHLQMKETRDQHLQQLLSILYDDVDTTSTIGAFDITKAKQNSRAFIVEFTNLPMQKSSASV
jgi:hypothetical protein